MATVAECRKRHSELDSPSAALDVDLLLCHVLRQPRYYLYAHDDVLLTDEQQRKFDTLLARRQSGEPVAYLVGEVEFWSLTLAVSPATLIPRPDTELLVEWLLESLPTDAALKVLDLGTGTGAIALALASERPAWQVCGVDRQREAVELAASNAQRLALDVEFLQSDWFDVLGGRRFDVAVSNPPYIAEDDEHLTGLGVKYEPRSALVAGPDGLDDIRRIVEAAPSFMQAGGLLLLEHGYRQAAAVAAILRGAGFVEVETRRDYGGNPRATRGRFVGEVDHA